MFTLARFREIEAAVRAAGYSSDIERSENPTSPATPTEFAAGAIYVIVNSGMRNSIARPIVERCMVALRATNSCRAVFGHPGKAIAIDDIWRRRSKLFKAYLASEEQVTFLASLPWIGPITKFHLAKNFGGDFAKPDVHLNRLAEAEDTTAQELCERLGREAGYRAATVDLILWRACADRIIDSQAWAPTVQEGNSSPTVVAM